MKAEPAVIQTMQYRDDVIEEQKLKPKLFSYPNWNESITVFDFEDLQATRHERREKRARSARLGRTR